MPRPSPNPFPSRRRSIRRAVRELMALSGVVALLCAPASAGDVAEAGARLLAAYPDHLARVDGNDLVWRDGTRMPLDDGKGEKPFQQWLAAPDVEDMLAKPYPRTPGAAIAAPRPEWDPGRARNRAFFDKMYGNCESGAAARNLVEITWLAGTAPQKLKATRVNGVATRLQAVSRALEALPPALRPYLVPSAGTYNCRVIAGTNQPSAHGWGIAIDIATANSDYWRWARPGPDGSPRWRNRIPAEIVAIFERHGFIWGGRWSHFDTMHFEYRPELLPPEK